MGNRLTRASTLPGLPNQTFTYTANDQLTSDIYDANGNTIAATVSDPYTGTPVSATDTYDHADRLIHRATTLNSQSAAIAYEYDGDGNRVGKTVGGVTTHFVVDEANPTGWPQVLEELSAPSTQLSTLAVTRVYSYGYGPLSQDQLSGNTWSAANFGHDAHGNVRYVTDSAGHATDTFDYDAFGSLIQRSGSTAATRLFTGEELDPELGLYNLRARYHNPATGRFWTRDSFEGYLASPASRHVYAYTLNNPLNMVDPSGHEGLGELSAVGAIAPDVDRAVSSLWSGINHYLYGIAGGAAAGADGKAVLAANGQEGIFIQGLSQHAGINIGRDNFFATMRGAPFLLAPNPFVFASPSQCFRYELLGFNPGVPIYGCPNRDHIFEFNFETSPGYLAMRETIEPINILADIGGFFMASAAGYGESYEGNSLLFEKLDANAEHIDPNKARAQIALGTLRAEAGILTFGLSEGTVSLAQGDYQKAQNEFATSAVTLGLARALGGADALDELLPSVDERNAVTSANRIKEAGKSERAIEALKGAEADVDLANDALPIGIAPGQPCTPTQNASKAFPSPVHPNRFQGVVDQSHLNGLVGEEQLANRINGLSDEQVVLWGKKVGTRGADVVSVNLETGEVTLWDSKWRTNPTTIDESPTFSGTRTRQNAIDEATIAIRNDPNLPPDVQQTALDNLQQGHVRLNTTGEGPGSLNSHTTRY